MIDTRAALAELFQHIDELGDYDEFEETFQALRRCGDQSLVPDLTAALHRCLDAGDFYGRDLIAGILAGIQGVVALPVLMAASKRDLGDDQDTLSTEIVDLVHGDRAAARPIVLAAATSPEPRLRRLGLNILGLVALPEDTDLLLEAAADPDPAIRRTAFGALPADSDRTFPALVTALRDVDAGVRVTAVAQLGYHGSPDAVPHLIALAADHDDQVRGFVAYALGLIGDPKATPTLLRLHGDRIRSVRDHAVEALGAVGGPAAIAALRAMAENPDPEVRIDAAEALPKTAADVTVRPLLAALAADPVPEVRTALVRAMTKAPAESDLGGLLTALSTDPEHDVRQAVALTVRHAAPAIAPTILTRYLDDPDLARFAQRELDRLTP